jgi:hypothetical protein
MDTVGVIAEDGAILKRVERGVARGPMATNGRYRRSMSTEERIRAFYAAFNRRAIDAVLAELTADVDWPNGWEGGRLAGHEAVRDYWLRQWRAIGGRVEPVEITPCEDGRWMVLVHQVVRSPDGALLADEHVHVHVHHV